MFILGNIIVTFAKVLSMIATVYTYVILGTVIISWVRPDPYNPIVRFLRQVTEPIFIQVRRLMPRFLLRTGLDFTPMIVLILLFVLDNLVIGTLYHYGQRLMVGG